MSKKLKANYNNSNKVPQWSSSDDEIEIIESKSPKKVIINLDSKAGKKLSSKIGSGSDSASDA